MNFEPFTGYMSLPKFVFAICSKDMVDPCSPDPCQNGATCNPNGMDYFCDCPTGFTGMDCETG